MAVLTLAQVETMRLQLERNFFETVACGEALNLIDTINYYAEAPREPAAKE